MALLVGEPYDFILYTWAVSGAYALNLTAVKGRAVDVFEYYLLCFIACVGGIDFTLFLAFS